MIHCGKRKEEKCKEVPDICEWDGIKCKSIIPKTKVQNEDKAVRCGKRKEEKCKEVPDICEWDGVKCNKIKKSNKTSSSKTPSKASPKASLPVNSSPKTSSPVNSSPKASSPVNSSPKASSPVNSSPKASSPVNSSPKASSPKASSPKASSPKASSPKASSPQELVELKNRHCFYYNNKNIKYTDIVNLDTPNKIPYNKTFSSETNVHMGQRKLLLSEIQLITEYYKNNTIHPVVLYVGSAPGTHLITLSIMFPNVYFILYDGANFDPILKNYPNVYDIHEGESGFVTTDTIKTIKSKLNPNNLLFISDIRLGDKDKIKFENAVMKDMENQQEWIEILKPKMSLLKFRISYNMKHDDKLKYTKGDILYGVWPPGTSGETRLLVKQNDIFKKINYDFKDYEETMSFHNRYQRPYCHQEIPETIKNHIFVKNNNYCPCYDCLAELSILYKYSLLTKQDYSFVIQEFRKLNKKNALFKEKKALQLLKT